MFTLPWASALPRTMFGKGRFSGAASVSFGLASLLLAVFVAKLALPVTPDLRLALAVALSGTVLFALWNTRLGGGTARAWFGMGLGAAASVAATPALASVPSPFG